LIEVNGLTVRYGKKVALDNISFTISDAEHLVLMGKNGSGKTTLLKGLLGFVPYSGEISIDGRSLRSMGRREMAREISYVPQIFSSTYTFTVGEFVSMGLYSITKDWWQNNDGITEYLDMVGISDLKDKMINNLSGGELQKAVVARALAQDSRYILMDEPTAHLDIKSVQEILDIISHFQDKSIVIVSHDLNPVNKLNGEVMLLKDGRIIFKGKKEDLSFADMIRETFDADIRKLGDYLYFPLT
jgi:iron complex transport system ATP-binding protein